MSFTQNSYFGVAKCITGLAEERACSIRPCDARPVHKQSSKTNDTRGPVAVPRSRAHPGQCRTTDYATVLLPLPGISNDLEVVRLL
jgi:hypothetical protein